MLSLGHSLDPFGYPEHTTGNEIFGSVLIRMQLYYFSSPITFSTDRFVLCTRARGAQIARGLQTCAVLLFLIYLESYYLN
jgi:hypothetical protein